MSKLLHLDKVIYGVEDLPLCRRYFTDWGLRELDADQNGAVFETLEGSQVILRDITDPDLPEAVEDGPTVRQVIWAVADAGTLDSLEQAFQQAGVRSYRSGDTLYCTDPTGLSLGFRVGKRRELDIKGSPTNAYGRVLRRDAPSPCYERAEPVRLSHIVFFTDIFDEHVRFYTELLGFHISDSYPGEGVFLRCREEGGHHDLFLVNNPVKPHGLNHLSFMVRDIYEVFGGGLHMSKKGWTTEMGPGRHPISSAMFWYVRCPGGALTEYYADEDYLTVDWVPREFERTPENFAEWSISGGIDANTRRQHK